MILHAVPGLWLPGAVMAVFVAAGLYVASKAESGITRGLILAGSVAVGMAIARLIVIQ